MIAFRCFVPRIRYGLAYALLTTTRILVAYSKAARSIGRVPFHSEDSPDAIFTHSQCMHNIHEADVCSTRIICMGGYPSCEQPYRGKALGITVGGVLQSLLNCYGKSRATETALNAIAMPYLVTIDHMHSHYYHGNRVTIGYQANFMSSSCQK